MAHTLHAAFSINNVGVLWQWMGRRSKREKDKADQPLLSVANHCCSFHSYLSKEKCWPLKLGIQHSLPQILALSAMEGTCSTAEQYSGSPIMYPECCFKRLYSACPLSLSMSDCHSVSLVLIGLFLFHSPAW